MRSFDEPPGFWPSSLAKRWTPGFGASASMRTSGVSPISPRTESRRATAAGRGCDGRRSAARDRGEDRDHVAVGDLGVEGVEVPDVVVVAVHVDELVQRA